ncbi:maleylpyruvate isomerase N-terminal domain-containing protein [Streptomyces sp. NBC_00257]|uniref:maleylpyruvate isomerase N-terminal domain-containing protein n=1 Tax=unclassified Streptomyces TaxID=2593676 RepID=UPI0022503CAD|nr:MULTISPECIES: maleylpyruvate isomerase N-terminal domain-containing protein [unclassified Streptomyces]WTB52997.1 maleylpyruvate isomerase N-terminal domain-containing protein [Streptomyces sp. NBC_00826]WTH94111.1 maleylpyruvate isomerase N-terminal domain-containing protein [Streptomyces sp. NBC_00825]WTI02846.1 maleylpyruvate isomerase N-terminal domain-containing protein [Streptomyces sp. NBC_00822]MCX4868500.1 maleylpyruvate isomerase N-terminal domain-containing protein [Streptomyces s
MGTVPGFDPVTEHEKTRAALRAVVPRLVRLLRDVPDPDASSGVPVWTVGDVGAHLAAVYLAYCSIVSAEEPVESLESLESVEWDSVLPPGDASFTERIAAMNAKSVELFGGDEHVRPGDFIAERGETFLRVTEGLAPDTPVSAPWYGKGATITLAAVTGLMLSESLVHGLDIARGTGLPWPIGPDEARLVLGQSMPTMMALALDTAKAQGVSIAFDVRIKGGLRLAVVVEDGTMTVTRDAPPRAYDCTITAAPATFLLVSFRRTPIWKAIARGHIRAGGRRPWLAMRLGELVASP